MRILIVDDEKLLVKGIKFNLENEGYEVETADNGEEAVALAKSGKFDLIMLDIMMPKLNGLEACMQIREFSTVPIIMVTARDDDMDKVIGFDYGADDYITKPFNILELKARVRALLRRSNILNHTEAAENTTVTIGNITLDTSSRVAKAGDTVVDLTGKEFELLELLMKNAGRVYSRENLLSIIWGYDYQGDTRTVDVHIHRLRDKLENNPSDPVYIITKWGVGYYFKG